ncbi:MAG TPA: Hpt domain-containing protein, partial [Alphaproteobacteria bacterium]|nr:Hpt domain-containing protein [Alphaproteobacteria bacterium]
SAGDAAAWCEAAHALKGSARGVGAKVVARISAEAEAMTEMPVSGERDRMLAALRGALTDVEAFAHASYPSFGQYGAGV